MSIKLLELIIYVKAAVISQRKTTHNMNAERNVRHDAHNKNSSEISAICALNKIQCKYDGVNEKQSNCIIELSASAAGKRC